MKCIQPKCHSYGTTANCPPYAPDINEIREIVKQYRYAILFMLKISSEDIVGPRHISPKKVFEIVSEIESAAFYDGYYLALGFAAGSCKEVWCHDVECSALKHGSGCRFPFKARSSMECAGMDVFMMATKMGWDIYPCGVNTKPEDLPHGTRLGLVLIY